MDRKQIEQAISELRQKSSKRNFTQSIDLILTFKELNLKKPENQVEIFIPLPHTRGKDTVFLAIVGPELLEQAKKLCQHVITPEDFPRYAGDKKTVKKLATQIDFVIAQVNFMPDIAKIFGRVLGPRGKMPNPKAGCVVPPNANLTPLIEKLKKTLKFSVKTQLNFKCRIGKESMQDSEISENILTIINAVVPVLPQEKNNLKHVILKTTMGPPVMVQQ